MIVNYSFHVTSELRDKLLAWLRSEYIPAALASGVFHSPLLAAIETEVQPGTASFALHLTAPDLDAADRWLDTVGAQMLLGLANAHPERVVFFRTNLAPLPL